MNARWTVAAFAGLAMVSALLLGPVFDQSRPTVPEIVIDDLDRLQVTGERIVFIGDRVEFDLVELRLRLMAMTDCTASATSEN